MAPARGRFPRLIFAVAGALVVSGTVSPGTLARVWADDPSSQPPPNVVILLCDDLGYGDLACYGHPHIRTPHLDALAAGGVRLTDCYAASAVCSSSRAGLLTGRSPNRSGIYDWLPEGSTAHLSTDEPTIPAMLAAAGYQSAIVGKWHLNGFFNHESQPQPDDYGFEHWFATQNNAAPSHERPTNFVRNGIAVGPTDGFSCQEVADEACRWMGDAAKSDSPFYMHVCFHEPHEPVASPADLVRSYAAVAVDDDQAQYFANVTNMDAAVGQILQQLRSLGIADQTLVVFTSDNGPETLLRYPSARRSHGSPGPLREMKLHMYEGGIRVPGIVRWPGVVAAGRTDATPISGVDWLPTLREICGGTISSSKTLDGENLAGWLRGEPWTRSRPLHWMYYRSRTAPKFAIRDGRYKLLASWNLDGARSSTGQPPGNNITPDAIAAMKTATLTGFELYDLTTDIGERNNVINSRPEIATKMRADAEKIFAELIAEGPQWPPRAERMRPRKTKAPAK